VESLLLVVVTAAAVALGVHLVYRTPRPETTVPPSEAPYKRAITCLVHGDQDEALRHLKETVRRDTNNVEAYAWLGDLLRQRGQPARALAIHRELAVRHLTDPALEERIYESLTRDYLMLDRPANALLAAEKLRALNRQNRTALELLLKVYEAQRDWDKACATAEELARLDGRGASFVALYKSYIGRDHLTRGQHRDALRWLKDALRTDGRCLQALLSLGDVYYAEGKLDQAISLWRAVTMRHPKLAYLVFDRLEKVYFEKGIFSEVYRIYEELLREDGRDARTLLALATMHERKGETERALRLVREALEHSPSDLHARHQLVRLLAERGEIDAVMNEVSRLIEPPSSDAVGSLTCRRCGTRAPDVFWRCPRCEEWETYVV
jgi:lipopolysaccharide biosynthesis regulator YciM